MAVAIEERGGQRPPKAEATGQMNCKQRDKLIINVLLSYCMHTTHSHPCHQILSQSLTGTCNVNELFHVFVSLSGGLNDTVLHCSKVEDFTT